MLKCSPQEHWGLIAVVFHPQQVGGSSRGEVWFFGCKYHCAYFFRFRWAFGHFLRLN
jgi:hypothetical protein